MLYKVELTDWSIDRQTFAFLYNRMISFIVSMASLALAYGADPCAFQALSMHFGNGCTERANYRAGGEQVETAIKGMNSLLNVSEP